MPAYTTSIAVQNILISDYDTVNLPDLVPFIETAHAFVLRVEECAIERGDGLSEDEKELLERWLAAHFYQQSDQGYAEKRTERSSAKFHGDTGMYLESTKYGQTAAKLDFSGCLEALAGSERKVARAFWAGKPPSSQIPYDQRD